MQWWSIAVRLSGKKRWRKLAIEWRKRTAWVVRAEHWRECILRVRHVRNDPF